MTQSLLIRSSPSAQSDEHHAQGEIAVPVTLANANAMVAAGEAFISGSTAAKVSLDMQNVEATSVAVAVALAWLAAATRESKELCLGNLSSDFSGVIEFSGITSMFEEHISAARTVTEPESGG